MAYNRFTLSEAKKVFQLITNESRDLFSAAAAVEISDFLRQTLEKNLSLGLAINTEKARSELIVAPILVELLEQTHHQISLFSGKAFNVDKKRGLSGACGFIISLSTEQLFITTPVIAIVEAKNDNPMNGIGQCVAEMVAARLFNEHEGNNITTIYGGITTGSVWKFLKLEGQTVYIDLDEYHINDIGKILGILLSMIHSIYDEFSK